VKFADEWMPGQPGTDGALAMAMGHVILSEFFVQRAVPRFLEYVTTYTDLPFLVTLEERDGAHVPGKFLTAADLAAADGTGDGPTEAEDAFKTVVWDAATQTPAVPNGSLGFRYAESGAGLWNLELGAVKPALSCEDTGATAEVLLPRFDDADGGVLRRGVPTRTVAGRTVTTVYDLLLAQYGVGRPGLPGVWPQSYEDTGQPYTPAWQEPITGVPAAQCTRVAREFADNAERSGGRSMILMGPARTTGSTPTPPTGRCWPSRR